MRITVGPRRGAALLGIAAAVTLLAGCNNSGSPDLNKKLSAQDLKADTSHLTPEQQKMMQDGFKRMGQQMQQSQAPGQTQAPK